MPKDNPQTPPPAAAPSRPGVVRRFFSWLFASGHHARNDIQGTHMELFRMRGELAVLRAEVEAMHAALGRRDITTLEELWGGGNRRQVEALIRDRTQTVSLPDGSVLCRVLGRYKMYTDAKDASLAPHLLLDGYWQYWVTAFVCRNVSRGETAYDVGAIYGYYTILLADLVGREGRVVALEPNPWLNWLVRRNIVLNGLGRTVTAHRLAAADAKHDAMRLRAKLTGPADGPHAGRFTREAGRITCESPAEALQDFETGRVDFLRIGSPTQADVIVAGLPGLLDRNPGTKIVLAFDANRCAGAPAMLAALAERFPLRYIAGDSRAKPCTIEDLLERRRITMLYLSNVEPR